MRRRRHARSRGRAVLAAGLPNGAPGWQLARGVVKSGHDQAEGGGEERQSSVDIFFRRQFLPVGLLQYAKNGAGRLLSQYRRFRIGWWRCVGGHSGHDPASVFDLAPPCYERATSGTQWQHRLTSPRAVHSLR